MELRYLFASWDFAKWFADLELQPEEDFGGYSYDLVFRYEYVGLSLWQHGGVCVTCKERVSTTGSRHHIGARDGRLSTVSVFVTDFRWPTSILLTALWRWL